MEILWVTMTTSIGVIGLAGAIMGYFAKNTTPWERILLTTGALLLIVPEKITDFIGLMILAGLFVFQRFRRSAVEPRLLTHRK